MLKLQLKQILIVFVIVCLLASCTESNNNSSATIGKKSKVSQTQNNNSAISYDYDIITFEQCLTYATHVFIATYNGTYIDMLNHIYYVFNIYDTLKGEKVEDTIYMQSGLLTDYLDMETFNPPYEKDQQYLLVVNRYKSLYYDFDRYSPMFDLFIPLYDLSKSKYVADLNQYSSYKFDETADASSLISYVKEIVSTDEAKQTRAYIGKDYTLSEDLEDVVDASTYICKVQIKASDGKALYEQAEIYKCDLITQIYGELKEEHYIEGLLIKFFSNTVKIGEEYIIMLNNNLTESSYIYTLTSKNSVRPVEDYDRIMEILKEQGKVS